MPKVRLDHDSIHAIAVLAAELLNEKLTPVLRLAEEKTAVVALRQKEWLTLKEVAWLLGTCDTTLRKKLLLSDLAAGKHNQDKLNGYRISKSSNVRWRFHRDEFRRFGPRFHPGSADRFDDGKSNKPAREKRRTAKKGPKS